MRALKRMKECRCIMLCYTEIGQFNISFITVIIYIEIAKSYQLCTIHLVLSVLQVLSQFILTTIL